MNSTNAELSYGRRRNVAVWLLVICAMVAIMVVIGGITRLTESGLSIVEWNVGLGWIPPLSEAEWQRQFDLYRQTSEFQIQFPYLDLEGFKTIFWWEYIHRVWGRLIGLVSLAGMGWCLYHGLFRNNIARSLAWHSVAIFVIISLQGAIGYWMVTSGFVGRDDVSQYRLTLHLGMAIGIVAYALWLAFGLLQRGEGRAAAPSALRKLSWVVAAVAFATILSGGMVAGINAGFIHNTWPLMDGGLLPDDFAALSPFWLNFFENHSMVQFDHRMMAYLTAILVAIFWFRARGAGLHGRAHKAAQLLGAMVLLQILLGIATLLLVVPISIAVLHQFGAVLLFGLAMWNAWELSLPRKAGA